MSYWLHGDGLDVLVCWAAGLVAVVVLTWLILRRARAQARTRRF